MIGDNLAALVTADDARAYAAAIVALMRQADDVAQLHAPIIDDLATRLDGARATRKVEFQPFADRVDELRRVLKAWLEGDPDGSLKDGDRVVATLARKPGKVVVKAEQLPDAFKSWQPDHGKINAALARGEKVQGVTVAVETSLRVLG
jgi:hypothetical protein